MNEKPAFAEAGPERPGVMQNRQLAVIFTKDDFEKLQRDYAYAVAEGFDSFIFKDREIGTDYAKKMIDFIDTHFGQ